MAQPALSQTPSQKQWEWNLPRLFIARCKQKGKENKIADSSGIKLSGHDLLIRTLVLRRIFNREILQPEEKYVGVLLPPTVPGAVANTALALGKRIAVNLNYTVSESIINNCIEQAGIKTVLTSSKIMDRLGIKPNAKLVYLEDFKEKATVGDKVAAVMGTRVYPTWWLTRHLGLHQLRSNDLLTVIFTSGSTGNPKGVPLSLLNVASNIQGFDEFIGVRDTDNFLGILPFFHSFGFTVTLWGALTLNSSASYHYNPLEPRQIAKLVESSKSTVLLGTPTFLRTYLRRIEPEQFKSIEVVVVGAEKMPLTLADAFEERFGVRPVEGYGTTELSPVAAVNVPPSRAKTSDPKAGLRDGSVGKPIPGVSARVVSLEDGKVVDTGVSGMIQISGPNVMQGYMNQPELTAKVMKESWYETGDVGYIDSDGFIFITGRQSRFSKIGGEMVPHIQIEEAILTVLGDSEDEINVGVTSVPDEKKGSSFCIANSQNRQVRFSRGCRKWGCQICSFPRKIPFFRWRLFRFLAPESST
jgi:acyl-[acyl-carrier-protein]-phospholipid O-acyltransferase / long-chain-fatty-acid--[acyl-carrier-protein] ligase